MQYRMKVRFYYKTLTTNNERRTHQMGKPKNSNRPQASKNNPENRNKGKQTKMVSSITCDSCTQKCKAYKEYELRLQNGAIGHGVRCHL